MEELKALYEKVVVSFSEAVKAREKLSRIAAENVCRIEDEVDAMEEELRNKHIERLSSGLCKPSNGVISLIHFLTLKECQIMLIILLIVCLKNLNRKTDKNIL